MKMVRALVPLFAAMVIVLTFLLVQGTAPDVARHGLTLDALRTLILQNAALERDVLRARAGLLGSYDPLVQSIDQLNKAAARLRAVREIAVGDERSEIERRVAAVAAAVREQESLVETFKTENALLQNSLNYFHFLTGRFAAGSDNLGTAAPADVGALTTAMLRFVGKPGPETEHEATLVLDRLSSRPILPSNDVRSIIAHGRLIVSTLPAVDDIVARLQAVSTNDLTRALQDAYLDVHGRATARSDIYRTLLYMAAVALGVYVAYLFVRLRANARALAERLELEDLIAGVSTQFINLPRERIRTGVGEGLARLARKGSLSSAQIIVCCAGEIDVSRSHQWPQPATAPSGDGFETLADLALKWPFPEYERQGCTYVADVRALPDGQEKTSLQSCGVRSWLRMPMRCAGEQIGLVTLGSASEMRWRDDDIAQLRTAADIFANAIARERNEAEREALQARLNQSQRLEAIGTLASGIAHEFNNILGAILGYGEMALAVLQRRSPARAHVGQMMKAGKRAQDVVEQVLTFGRQHERRHRLVRAEPTVAEAIELIRASLPATLLVRAHLRAGGAVVKIDPTELQQVVMNLGTNAAHAMDGQGTIEIELNEVESGDALTLSHGSLTAGRYVRLVVRDRGHGIDRATMARIFEPFFTTKPVGEGAGLGLSIVYGIVTEHGGGVHVESGPGKGTTFEVFLPRIADADILEEAAPEAPVRLGHGETILIVDDDRSLMLLGEEMLAALGYEPVGFDHGPAALSAFRAAPERFDLALTDEVMPQMTGTELAGALCAIRPDLPVILMTGCERSHQCHRLQTAGIREILRKPLRSKDLAECLTRHLRGDVVSRVARERPAK